MDVNSLGYQINKWEIKYKRKETNKRKTKTCKRKQIIIQQTLTNSLTHNENDKAPVHTRHGLGVGEADWDQTNRQKGWKGTLWVPPDSYSSSGPNLIYQKKKIFYIYIVQFQVPQYNCLQRTICVQKPKTIAISNTFCTYNLSQLHHASSRNNWIAFNYTIHICLSRVYKYSF